MALLACSCGAEGKEQQDLNPAQTNSAPTAATTSEPPNQVTPADNPAEASSGAVSPGDNELTDQGSASMDNSSEDGPLSPSAQSPDGVGMADPSTDAGTDPDMSTGDGLTGQDDTEPTSDDEPGVNSSTASDVTDGGETTNSIDDSEGTDTSSGNDVGGELVGTPTQEERVALPTVRQEHGAAELNGEVYVLGGFTPQVTASVQAYSPDTDTWRDVASFPAEFHHPNVAVVNGLMYVTGFHLGSSLRVADPRAYAYDPETDEWTPRSALPAGTERGSACVATLGTKIYLFGGASDRTLPDASAYDTELDSWEVLPLMPALREHCLAAGIGGKVYIVSGRSGSIEGVHVESWMYDPETQTYTERAPIPTPRGGAAGAVIKGRIFVLGGEGNADASNGIFSQVEAYDPALDAWESFPDMLIPRHGYAAAVVDERIYLPGGATSQGFGAADDHTVFYFDASN